MFYQTQVKSVSAGGVIDSHGKCLSVIGNKIVQAGDIVWTDGHIVFGHTPIRGGSFIPTGDRSIPVLGDNPLRGYFSNKGIFKPYKIAGVDWIVNSKDIYSHDQSNSEIIDAEVALDDEGKATGIYTAEKKNFLLDDAEEDDPKILFYRYVYSRNTTLEKPNYRYLDYYSMLNLDYYSRGADVRQSFAQSWWSILNPNTADYIKNSLPIVKPAYFEDPPSDDPYGVRYYFPREFLFKTGNTIIKDSQIILRKNTQQIASFNLSSIVKPVEELALSYIAIEIPQQVSFDCVKSRAELINFKINPNGTWVALVEIEIGAERGFPSKDTAFYDDDTIIGTLFRYEWQPHATTAVHSLFLYKIFSDGTCEQIAQQNYFMPLFLIRDGHPSDPIYFNDGFHFNDGVPRDPHASAPKPFQRNPTSFPYDDLYQASLSWNTGTGDCVVVYWIFTVYDSHLLSNAPPYNIKILSGSNTFLFPIQDGFLAKLKNFNNNLNMWMVDGIFNVNSLQICSVIPSPKYDAHKWNMSCTSLQGGQYLFGIREDNDREVSGALYKVNKDGNAKHVGGGLKNFRLRELNPISKSRR